jgi:transposase
MSMDKTRIDYSVDELLREAGHCRDARQARRLLAFAMSLEGAPHDTAARAAHMSPRRFRDWLARFNQGGIEELMDRPKSGRLRLNDIQLRELDAIVAKGPCTAVHGTVRWRCADLQTIVATRFGVHLSEQQIGRILKQRGHRHPWLRRRHVAADAAADAPAANATKPRSVASLARPWRTAGRPTANNLVVMARPETADASFSGTSRPCRLTGA